jgi:hypothetical protein
MIRYRHRGPVMFGTTPKRPRCLNCANPMQLSRGTLRYGALPDLYSFYCVICDEWHVEEGEAVRLVLARGTAHKT